MAERIALVACVGKKADEPQPARELYRSTWFVGARLYAEQTCDRWFILSAKHGLLSPDAMVAPYDETLSKVSKAERSAWARGVLAQLALERIAPDATMVVLAGLVYREHLHRALPGMYVEVPMQGLGIGEQLAWLKKHTRRTA